MASNCTSSNDLSCLPDISFAFVENFITGVSSSSGNEQMTKGFKYYSEGYVHSLKLYRDGNECLVKGRCFRSQKKNESPHVVEVVISAEKVSSSTCSCTIGQSGACGHVTALLYQLAYYKSRKMRLIPADTAKTSLPQTWHQPRGEKLKGSKVDDIVVQGYDRSNPHRATKGIKSTMYNPIPEDAQFNASELAEKLKDFNMLFPTVFSGSDSQQILTPYGKFVKGSILSYQQRMCSDYIMNLVDIDTFIELPSSNVMTCNVVTVLTENQTVQFDTLTVSETESWEIEKNTRLQSRDPRWHSIRKDRITASNAGEIAKRRKDGEKLAERLRSTRHVTTAAMKHGLESEGLAAKEYSKRMNDSVNLYPSGIIVSPFCHWLAATPDRKVYNPNRSPPYGLLEIKCPVADTSLSLKYLAVSNDALKLKTNHNYYYQVQMQLAVTGLEWCDFCVWLENDFHVETILFDREFWEAVKDMLDLLYYRFYLS